MAVECGPMSSTLAAFLDLAVDVPLWVVLLAAAVVAGIVTLLSAKNKDAEP